MVGQTLGVQEKGCQAIAQKIRIETIDECLGFSIALPRILAGTADRNVP